MTPTLPAVASAELALVDAGVTVRRLETLEGVRAAAQLFAEVWRSPEKPPLAADVMRAIEHAGGYVMGAFDGDTLVGASSGFLAMGEAGDTRLHSHISGVLPAAQGRRVGWAMKLHQRAWALERGIETITWTFDPLVRRNAWFNLGKLGAHGVEYLVDFYGPMHDGLNAGDHSDRLFVRWDLLSPAAVAAAEGRPMRDVPADAILIELPADIEQLRIEAPESARAWRTAVRDALAPLLDNGHRATGVTPEGCLVVESPATH